MIYPLNSYWPSDSRAAYEAACAAIQPDENGVVRLYSAEDAERVFGPRTWLRRCFVEDKTEMVAVNNHDGVTTYTGLSRPDGYGVRCYYPPRPVES